jgi:hypothetical protein
MSETYRLFTLNVPGDPANNGAIENALLKKILDFLPQMGGTFVTTEHKHIYLYGPTNPDAQIICTDNHVYLAAGTNSFGISNLDDHAFLKGYLRIGDAATPLGILHLYKETGITDTDSGINLQVGNITPDAGTFTRCNSSNVPVILSDCGVLKDGGLLKIIDRGDGRECMGFGFVSVILSNVVVEQAFFSFMDGTVTLISNSANVVITTNTANKLCIEGTAATSTTSSKIKIRNNLGYDLQMSYFIWYASDFYITPP